MLDCSKGCFNVAAVRSFLRTIPSRARPHFLKQPTSVEVLNDINGDLVSLYRVLTHHLEEFVRQFKWAISSRQVFEWQKMTRPETLTDIQRAARFYYMQHHAFGGKVDGQNYGTATTAPMINLLRIEESLSAAHLRLSQGTNVEHLHWLDCMKRYDRDHTFFYCDPPYWEPEGYGVPFEYDQYEKMAAYMKACKGKVMVSINDHPDIRRAYDGLTIIDGEGLGIKYSVANAHGKPETSKELVILNYDPLKVGGLF
jgi:DNA adenine methylase